MNSLLRMKASLAAAAAVLNDQESFHNLQLAEADEVSCPSGSTISRLGLKTLDFGFWVWTVWLAGGLAFGSGVLIRCDMM